MMLLALLLLPVQTPGLRLAGPLRLIGVLIPLVLVVLETRTPGIVVFARVIGRHPPVVLVLLEGTFAQVVREAVLDVFFTNSWLLYLTIGEGELGHIIGYSSLQRENISTV